MQHHVNGKFDALGNILNSSPTTPAVGGTVGKFQLHL